MRNEKREKRKITGVCFFTALALMFSVSFRSCCSSSRRGGRGRGTEDGN